MRNYIALLLWSFARRNGLDNLLLMRLKGWQTCILFAKLLTLQGKVLANSFPLIVRHLLRQRINSCKFSGGLWFQLIPCLNSVLHLFGCELRFATTHSWSRADIQRFWWCSSLYLLERIGNFSCLWGNFLVICLTSHSGN